MKKSKVASILLVVCMLFTFLPDMVHASQYADERVRTRPTDDILMSASEHKFEGFSIDELRQVLLDGRPIYQNLRIQ